MTCFYLILLSIVFSATKKFVEHMDVAHGILKPFPCLYEGNL